MRYVIPLAIVFVAAGAMALTYLPSFPWANSSRVPDYTPEEMQAIFDREEANEKEVERIRRFQTCMVETKKDLRSGRTTLAAAVKTIESAADSDNPNFHRVIKNRFPDLPERERLGVLLIDHLSLEADHHLAPSDAARVETLATELKHWPGVKQVTLTTLERIRHPYVPR